MSCTLCHDSGARYRWFYDTGDYHYGPCECRTVKKVEPACQCTKCGASISTLDIHHKCMTKKELLETMKYVKCTQCDDSGWYIRIRDDVRESVCCGYCVALKQPLKFVPHNPHALDSRADPKCTKCKGWGYTITSYINMDPVMRNWCDCITQKEAEKTMNDLYDKGYEALKAFAALAPEDQIRRMQPLHTINEKGEIIVGNEVFVPKAEPLPEELVKLTAQEKEILDNICELRASLDELPTQCEADKDDCDYNLRMVESTIMSRLVWRQQGAELRKSSL